MTVLIVACGPVVQDGDVLAGDDRAPSTTEDESGRVVGQEPTPSTTIDPASDEPTVETASRLASHLFVPVGERRSVEGLGRLLEVIPIDGDSIRVEDGHVVADQSGISCLRYQYRSVPGENGVQTMCVVGFDETDSCTGQEPLRLDLDAFLDPQDAPSGDSNLLSAGSLYSVCRTVSGDLRLSQPNMVMPPLYFVIVDALTDGPYSLGDDEFERQRRGLVTTYSGETIQPPWIVTVSREVDTVLIEDGRVRVNDEDCSRVPSCTDDTSVVAPGDIFRTSLGLSPDQLQDLMESMDRRSLDQYVGERIGVSWDEVASVHPDATSQVFSRLAVLDIMGDLLDEWDSSYRLRDRGVNVAYWQPWFVERELTVHCFPDETEQARCRDLEDAVRGFEEAKIADWRRAGYRLWQSGFLDTTGRFPMEERRPHWSAFEGVMAGIGAQDLEGRDLADAYAAGTASLAATIHETTPVILFLTGPPIEAQTTGDFCEAEICSSDFGGAYDMAEGALIAALEHMTPGQLRGFGVALFDGAHFDILHPHEQFDFPLNRVGETGYNHPILNLWRAS